MSFVMDNINYISGLATAPLNLPQWSAIESLQTMYVINYLCPNYIKSSLRHASLYMQKMVFGGFKSMKWFRNWHNMPHLIWCLNIISFVNYQVASL